MKFTNKKSNSALLIGGVVISSLSLASSANASNLISATPIGSGGEIREALTASENLIIPLNELTSKEIEAKCGEKGKAKEAKCGEKGKAKEAKCGEKGKAKEAKCGEKGKAKEAKCGEKGKAKEAKCGEKGKVKEAKCGEK